jgi:large subunit ribosomal protein L9
MKVLLRKNIAKLGIVGDVVEVAAGYARNYLFPQRLATEPTDANMKSLAEARKLAEQERAEQRARMTALAERMAEVEITVAAKANAEGILYGSVGAREIAAALNAEGHDVSVENVKLREPIRRLDSSTVEVQLLEDIKATVKVWVVREKSEDDEDERDEDREEGAVEAAESASAEAPAEDESGTEASDDDHAAG